MANSVLEGLRGKPITSPSILELSKSFYSKYSPNTNPMGLGFLAGIGSSLIGGIGSFFSQRSANKFAAQQNALNRQFAHDEAALAFDRNWNQMLYQNEYNSPANQRKLFEQAGVNYQNIVGNQGNVAVSKSGNAASNASAPGSLGAQQMQMDWANGIANIGLINAQTKLINAQAGAVEHDNNLKDTQSGYYGSLTAGQDIENGIREKYGSLEAFARVNNLEADTFMKDAQRFNLKVQEKLGMFDLTNLKPAQQANFIANTMATEADYWLKRAAEAKTVAERDIMLRQAAWNIAYTKSCIALNYQSIRESDSRIFVNRNLVNHYGWQNRLINSQIGLNNSLSKESKSRYDLNVTDGFIRNLDASERFYIHENVFPKATYLLDKRLNYQLEHLGWRDSDNVHSTFWNGIDEFSKVLNVGVSYDATPHSPHIGSTPIYLPPQ